MIKNIPVLHAYLTKYLVNKKGLDEDKANLKSKDLIKKHKDNLFSQGGLAVWLGEKSIEFFCMYFLQDTFVPKEDNIARELSQTHYEVWRDLEKMFIDDLYDNLCEALPRGYAKTTFITFALTVWCHCYKKSFYSLVCGCTEQDSIEFIQQARQAFEENEYIIEGFGDLVNTRRYTVNKLELELANQTKIQALSSKSSIRGKKYRGNRPSLIIGDDYQNKDDVITEEAREKKYRRWTEDSKYAGDKPVYRKGKKIKAGTKFIVLGTILHEDCFISRILRDKTYKSRLEKAVLLDDVDDYFNNGLWAEFRDLYFNSKLEDSEAIAKEFYYQHENEMQFKTLWPDKWDCLETAIDYFSNPVAFKQEMQNDASKIGKKYFASLRTMSSEEIEQNSFEKTMLCVDPKGTGNKNKAKEDYCAMVVGSLADNSFKYIRESILEKYDYDAYIDKVIELLIKFDDITHLYIEKNVYMGADVIEIEKRIINSPTLRHRNLKIINEMQKKNKDEKISTIIGDVNNGRLIFCPNDRFNNQIMEFAGQDYSQHDDAPDITAELAIRIDAIEVIRNIRVFDKRQVI